MGRGGGCKGKIISLIYPLKVPDQSPDTNLRLTNLRLGNAWKDLPVQLEFDPKVASGGTQSKDFWSRKWGFKRWGFKKI